MYTCMCMNSLCYNKLLKKNTYMLVSLSGILNINVHLETQFSGSDINVYLFRNTLRGHGDVVPWFHVSRAITTIKIIALYFGFAFHRLNTHAILPPFLHKRFFINAGITLIKFVPPNQNNIHMALYYLCVLNFQSNIRSVY